MFDLIKFSTAVLEFLKEKYTTDYSFTIEKEQSPSDKSYQNERMTLVIEMTPQYKITVVDATLRHLYKLYKSGSYVEERNQYTWQKELVDIIDKG